MKARFKRYLAIAMTVLIIFSMVPTVFAVTSGEVVEGNNPDKDHDILNSESGSIYLDVSDYNLVKFDEAIIEGKSYDYGFGSVVFTKVDVSDPDGVDKDPKPPKPPKPQNWSWTSTSPISYFFIKTGDFKPDQAPYYIEGQENQTAYLFNIGGATSGEFVIPTQQGISHFFVFTKTPDKGMIKVIKTLSGDPPPTSATFTFELYEDKETLESPVDTITITGANEGYFKDVEFGNYIVKEVSIPDKYQVTANDQEVTVVLNNLSPTVTFNNEYTEKYTISVKKLITGDTPPEGVGFTFNLIRVSDSEVLQSATIKENEVFNFDPVPAGQYKIEEVGLPDGFTVVTENPSAVSVDGRNSNPLITFTNSYEKDKFNIRLIKAILGSPETQQIFKFQLWRANSEEPDTLMEEKNILGAGTITFSSVDAGEYYIREVLGSTDYELMNDNDIPVIVGPEVNTVVPTFTNAYLTYPIEVRKFLSEDSDIPLNPDAEFTFDLYNKLDLTTILQTLTLKVGESKSFDAVPQGDYVVVERKENMPEGFEQVAEPGEEDKEITVGPLTQNEPLTFINKFTRLYEIYVSKELYDENPEYRNLIGPTAVLPSFEFKLYNTSEPDVVIETIMVQAWSVGKFSPVPAGNYKVIESKTNSSYELYVGDGSPEEAFDLNEDFTAKRLLFVNRFVQNYDIEVEKTLIGGNANTVFTFRLYEVENPEYLQEIQIVGSGKASFDPVPAGEYYVKEVTVSGYVLETPNDVEAIVNSDFPSVTVSFRNRYEVTTETVTDTILTDVTTFQIETTTESTEDVTLESVPLGPAEETEEITDIVPLGPALPQTGQLGPEVYYGIGSLVSLLGIYMKKNSKK